MVNGLRLSLYVVSGLLSSYCHSKFCNYYNELLVCKVHVQKGRKMKSLPIFLFHSCTILNQLFYLK